MVALLLSRSSEECRHGSRMTAGKKGFCLKMQSYVCVKSSEEKIDEDQSSVKLEEDIEAKRKVTMELTFQVKSGKQGKETAQAVWRTERRKWEHGREKMG